jgi:Na+/H+ antiporter NhaC
MITEPPSSRPSFYPSSIAYCHFLLSVVSKLPYANSGMTSAALGLLLHWVCIHDTMKGIPATMLEKVRVASRGTIDWKEKGDVDT